MGTQQILLVVLGVIIVGISVTIALVVFGTSADQADKDAITQGCLKIVAAAQAYYRKPQMLGGGGNSFDGIQISDCGMNDAGDGSARDLSGWYAIASAAGDELVIAGTSPVNTTQTVTVTLNMTTRTEEVPYSIAYEGW